MIRFLCCRRFPLRDPLTDLRMCLCHFQRGCTALLRQQTTTFTSIHLEDSFGYGETRLDEEIAGYHHCFSVWDTHANLSAQSASEGPFPWNTMVQGRIPRVASVFPKGFLHFWSHCCCCSFAIDGESNFGKRNATEPLIKRLEYMRAAHPAKRRCNTHKSSSSFSSSFIVQPQPPKQQPDQCVLAI